MAKGIEFLKNDSFDPYFQACIFDFIYDLDKEAVLDCISSRTSDIDFYLFKDIVGTMMTFTTYEDFIKMKNHAAYSNFLLMQYEKYDESEMIDLLEEFKQEFHYAGSGRA